MAKKAADIISGHLAGKGLNEAQVIFDILAPLSSQDSGGNHWLSLVKAAFEGRGRKLEEEPIILSNDGWKAVGEAGFLPDCCELESISDGFFMKKLPIP
ncbi:MAG: hypothetical protein D4R88_03220 [Methanosarcinales archaeon]|nr:MAG: hypothetical protein D4R88_03220 [Methanosarcinales archaeon]